jgi:hypothetical protein
MQASASIPSLPLQTRRTPDSVESAAACKNTFLLGSPMLLIGVSDRNFFRAYRSRYAPPHRKPALYTDFPPILE